MYPAAGAERTGHGGAAPLRLGTEPREEGAHLHVPPVPQALPGPRAEQPGSASLRCRHRTRDSAAGQRVPQPELCVLPQQENPGQGDHVPEQHLPSTGLASASSTAQQRQTWRVGLGAFVIFRLCTGWNTKVWIPPEAPSGKEVPWTSRAPRPHQLRWLNTHKLYENEDGLCSLSHTGRFRDW